MSDAEVLTEEERLKALLYQYLALYERWSEDRQLVVKRDADYAALLQAFSKHLQSFRDLVPAVRKDTVESLQHALKQALAEESKPLQDLAKENLQRLVSELDRVVYKAQGALSAYESALTYEVKWNGLKIVAGILLSCLAVSFLAMKFIAPVRLTSEERDWIVDGQLLEAVFPLLSPQEKEHWRVLEDKVRREHAS
jgi:vacuolar-type H+-ATPase subunit E/Vma4